MRLAVGSSRGLPVIGGFHGKEHRISSLILYLDDLRRAKSKCFQAESIHEILKLRLGSCGQNSGMCTWYVYTVRTRRDWNRNMRYTVGLGLASHVGEAPKPRSAGLSGGRGQGRIT